MVFNIKKQLPYLIYVVIAKPDKFHFMKTKKECLTLVHTATNDTNSNTNNNNNITTISTRDSHSSTYIIIIKVYSSF